MAITEIRGFQVEGEDKLYLTREEAETAEALKRRIEETTDLVERTLDAPYYDCGTKEVVEWLLSHREAVRAVLA